MSARPLVTAVIGFGKVSAGYADDPVMARHYRYTTHAQVLRAHPAFDWQAVVDPAPEARAAAARWGVGAVVAQAGALANRERIEVAVLAMPPGPGRHEALAALPNLKAVIVEKPLGRTLAEARDFLAACVRRGVVVQVNLWRRADRAFRTLAAGELARRIGRLQTGFALYGNGLHNNGVHLVDLLRMLLGEIAAVQATAPAAADPRWPIPGDIQTAAALTFADGAQVYLAPLDFAAYREVGLDLWGDRGRLSILQEGLSIQAFVRQANRGMSGEYEIASDRPELMPSTVGDAFWELYEDLAAAVRQSGAVCSPGVSALRSEAVIEAIARSAVTGRREAPEAVAPP
jgi:predicted dehydrogenase